MATDDQKEDDITKKSASKKQSKNWGTKIRTSNRQPKKGKEEELFILDTTWSIDERKQLLDAFVEKYVQPEDVDKLVTLIPSKNKRQIEAEITRLKANIYKLEGSKKGNENLTTPLDPWLNLAEDIIFYDEVDHSRCLTQVLELAGKYEHTNETSSAKKPSYKRIYHYVYAALRGNDLPDLSPVENAIMLDLMNGLREKINSSDTVDKEKVMRWKYTQMKLKLNINQVPETVKMQNKAFLNDFPEEFGLDSHGQRRKINPVNANQHNPNPNPDSDNLTVQAESMNTNEIHKDSEKTSDTNPSKNGVENNLQCTSKDNMTTKESSDMTGASDSRERTPNNVDENNSPHTTSEDHVSMEDITEVSGISESRELTPNNVDENNSAPLSDDSTNKEGSSNVIGASDSRDVTPNESKRKSSDDEESDTPKKKISWQREALNKPKLLTVNPFCIPVGLLKFKPKQS